MRAKADHRHPLGHIRRDRRIDVAVLVEVGVGDAHLPQLGGEQAAQSFCFSVEGQAGEAGSGLCVDRDVTQEPLGDRVSKRDCGTRHRSTLQMV